MFEVNWYFIICARGISFHQTSGSVLPLFISSNPLKNQLECTNNKMNYQPHRVDLHWFHSHFIFIPSHFRFSFRFYTYVISFYIYSVCSGSTWPACSARLFSSLGCLLSAVVPATGSCSSCCCRKWANTW